MRTFCVSAITVAFMAAAITTSLAEVKKVPYAPVRVEVAEAYMTDAAFEMMRKSFAEAVAKKDSQALFSLVAPSFVWMAQGAVSDNFDFGRDALHNFKVVFGFREWGSDQDGGAEGGPFWDVLAAFAADESYYAAGSSLVCAPLGANLVDESAFDRAAERIGADDSVEWYFTIAETTATSTPDASGLPVGRVGQFALPVLSAYPPAVGEQQSAPVTHLEVLLPSGRSGWIPISAARPLFTDRLCYAATADGTWKIGAFDQQE